MSCAASTKRGSSGGEGSRKPRPAARLSAASRISQAKWKGPGYERVEVDMFDLACLYPRINRRVVETAVRIPHRVMPPRREESAGAWPDGRDSLLVAVCTGDSSLSRRQPRFWISRYRL